MKIGIFKMDYVIIDRMFDTEQRRAVLSTLRAINELEFEITHVDDERHLVEFIHPEYGLIVAAAHTSGDGTKIELSSKSNKKFYGWGNSLRSAGLILDEIQKFVDRAKIR